MADKQNNASLFKAVIFDVVGHCNARCPYCVTGANPCQVKAAISVDLFEKTLVRLLDQGAIAPGAVISLYCWGEPLLHPDLAGLAQVLVRLGLRIGISTNGSIRATFTPSMVASLDHIMFSMPGFSQRSYDRISRLPFERVRDNIAAIVADLRSKRFGGQTWIAYHIYQFNLNELRACERFAANLKIGFNPCVAMINEWSLLQGWLKGTLSVEQMRRISEDLLCSGVRPMMQAAPANYHCPQWDYLIIDEQANALVCCQTPKSADYQCGNILRDDIQTILRNKTTRPVCRDCLDTGLAYYINHALERPDFYEPLRHDGLLSRVYRSARWRFLRWKQRGGRGPEGASSAV